MKKRVELSAYSWTVSVLSVAVLCGVSVYILKHHGDALNIWILGTAVAILILSALFYMPLSVSLDTDNLYVRRPLKTKVMPLSYIAAVRLSPPTMGAIRVCGSGGWFGWYGWFRERDLGKYFSYYGKASDCFLITLKDGRRYLLGCKDARAMVEAIKNKLQN